MTTSVPEHAGDIPATGSAIASEALTRHASISDKLARLDGTPSVVAISYLAKFDPSKVSTAGAHAVEEVEQETPTSAILSSFNPGIALEPISKHAADGLVDMTLPCASLADLKAAATAMLPCLKLLKAMIPEGPDKVDLLAPYLRNFRAIDAAVGRALEALRAPPSRRDAIAAELTIANAALGRAVALGCDLAPVFSAEEATRLQEAAAAAAAEDATRRERAAAAAAVEEATRRERGAAAAIDAERAKAAALQAELDALRRPREIPVAPPASAAPEPEFAPHGLTPPQAAQLQAWVGGSGSPRAWAEVYRGSRDGFTAASLHGRCDDKARLLILVRDAEAGWLFGFYSARGFIKAGSDWAYADPAAFLFSLTNPAGRPERLVSKGNDDGMSCRSSCLAYLGSYYGCDLFIHDGCASNKKSYTNPGCSYAATSVTGDSHPMAGGKQVQFTVAELVAWTVPQ